MSGLRRARPLILLIIAVAAIWGSGLGRALSWAAIGREHAVLTAWVAAHPILSGALFMLAYIASTVLSLPQAAPLTLLSGLLFGVIPGAILSVLAATIGAMLLFLITRSALDAVVARRGGPIAARMRAALARDGFPYMLAIRLLPIFPFWLVNLAAPLSGIGLLPFTAATLVGMPPSAFILTSIGAGLGDALAAGEAPDLSALLSARVVLPLVGLALLSLASVVWKRRRRDA